MSEDLGNFYPIRVTVFEGSKKLLAKEFEKPAISFGRGQKMDIHLEYDFISRAHGSITFESGNWILTDLKSSNGITYLGQKIEKIVLVNGQSFQVGTLRFLVEFLSVEKAIETFNGDDEVTTPTFINPPVEKSDLNKTAATVRIGQTITEAIETPNQVPLAPLQMAVNIPAPAPASVTSSPLGRKPILGYDFAPEFINIHAAVGQVHRRKLEAVVTWHGQVYDIKEFQNGQVITVGPAGNASLKVPTLKSPWELARVGAENVQCFISKGHQASLARSNQNVPMADLIANSQMSQTASGFALKMGFQDVTHIDFGHGMQVHLRYVPASASLGNGRQYEADNAFKQSLISSAVLHGVFLFIMLLGAPATVDGPKLKNVPARYARLLIEKPKPKPTPIPPRQEKKKEIAKKEPPKPKEKRVVVQKIMKPPKFIQKVNKFPMVVKQPVPKAPPPVKVESLGALAALGPMSNSAQPNVVTNININKNAGGLPSKSINAGGIIGALPSSNGALLAGGGPRVKTKGMGFGTGTGYGVQGLKGTAGGRAVAGAVVGEPKLAKSGKLEGLSRAQVMAVIQKYLGEVQHCYERNLLMNPNLSGRMEFEWDISSGGSVGGVRVKRSTVNNGDGLGECVKELFAGMKFPRASNGQSTTPSIGFPFGRL